MHFSQVFVVLTYFLLTEILKILAFNISPVPNYIFKPPILKKTHIEQTESSLFGFSLNLRETSVLVGAPKGQSAQAAQRNVNQTGVIYKCVLSDNKCEPYLVDTKGNTIVEDTRLEFNSEKKDFQLLGFSMDGPPTEESKFVVCAPKLKANVVDHYLLHGICYWKETLSSEQTYKIAPLRSRSKQIIKSPRGDNIYYHMYGEQGFNVHMTDNKEEILIGAPGIYNWKGSVIRYRSRQKRKQTGFDKLNNYEQQPIEYITEIINPLFAGLHDDSYFGYAVTSSNFGGGNSYRVLYAASAPQANEQVGKVFIFDFIDIQNNFEYEKTMKIYREFESQQMGEYFGYSLLADDINNDGFPDLLISAPMYSKNSYFEHGGVYVYLNREKLMFELQTVLISDYLFGGRFGTSMGKLGDINHDGYNDVAVSAPLEDNGVVYIYHGSAQGISTKVAQRLLPPVRSTPKSFPGYMFGHSISRGVDIDGNGYNDIAVGAPYNEEVYVYKTYPVVQISATITTDKKEIGKNDTRFQVTACWRLFSSTNINHDLDFNIILKADMKYNRATWINKNKVYAENTTINNQVQCHEFDVAAKFSIANIFKPIEIEMEYQLINQTFNNSQFCETCAMISPTAVQRIQTSVIYSTGCKASMCIADLRIKSSLTGSRLPYILGSTKTLAVKYEVENVGEIAYLAQIRISLSNITSFSKVPSNCRLEDDMMLCDLESGSPIYPNHTAKLIINMDTTKLSGKELIIEAEVFSNGIEQNDNDNRIVDKLKLTEYSEIDIQGKSSKSQFAIEDMLENPNIIHEIEIVNLGPSNMKDLSIVINFPTIYNEIALIQKKNFTITATYKNSPLELTWYQFNHPLANSLAVSTLPPAVDVEYPHHYDVYQIETHPHQITKVRNRRNVEITSQQQQFGRIQRQQSIIDELPINRTIQFSCKGNDVETYSCMQIYAQLKHFYAGKDTIKIKINFTLELQPLNQVFDEKTDIFAMQANVALERSNDEGNSGFKINEENLPFTIVFKHFRNTLPLWIYVSAVLVGILVLFLITFIMYKCGFFKREKREELERLTKNENYTSYSNNIDDDDKYS